MFWKKFSVEPTIIQKMLLKLRAPKKKKIAIRSRTPPYSPAFKTFVPPHTSTLQPGEHRRILSFAHR
jgi:hypothetical protein